MPPLTVSPSLVAAFVLTSFAAVAIAYRGHLERTYYKLVHGKQPFPDYAALTGVPNPKPVSNFDIERTKPRPYRPFRWEYHQTMSLSKLDSDYWLELESTYKKRLSQRFKLYEEHGKSILYCTPGYELSARECMQMAVHFLCHRYPSHFKHDWRTGILENKILDKSFNLDEMDPLMVLLLNVPEDFLITNKVEKTGLYHLVAGVCCSAVGWSLGTKMGKPLAEIHKPVPDYKEKMEFSMDRYFSKMPTDKPIQRGSWGLEVGEPLFLQPNDPELQHRGVQDPNLDTADITLRVDHQTLRRLPQSWAIVFNFKALFTPFNDFRDEPFIPDMLLKVLTEGKKNILEYKGTKGVEHKVLPVLREWSEEQKAKGWVPKSWEPRTLDEHPFFPGWQQKYIAP